MATGRLGFLHDDYHFKNIVDVDGELMLIDIGVAAKGNPVFDVAQMGLAFVMTQGVVAQGLLPPDILGFDVCSIASGFGAR